MKEKLLEQPALKLVHIILQSCQGKARTNHLKYTIRQTSLTYEVRERERKEKKLFCSTKLTL